MNAGCDVVSIPALERSARFDAVTHCRAHAHAHAHGHIHGDVNAHGRENSGASAATAVITVLIGRRRSCRLVMVVVMMVRHLASLGNCRRSWRRPVE